MLKTRRKLSGKKRRDKYRQIQAKIIKINNKLSDKKEGGKQ